LEVEQQQVLCPTRLVLEVEQQQVQLVQLVQQYQVQSFQLLGLL
jgi:hypothetical protein